MEQQTIDTALPDSAPPEVDSAFQPLPSEVREHDRATYDGSWRESHPDPHSAAKEVLRKRKEAETAKTAATALREAVADSDIEEVSYLPGREPDENLSPLKAARDLAEFRQTKAAAQKEQLTALLQELTGGEQQPTDAALAQQPELQQQPQQPETAQQPSPEAVERTAVQQHMAAAENYGLALNALLHGSQQAAAEFNDIRSLDDLQKLSVTDPARMLRFQESLQRYQGLQVELARVRAQHQQVAHAQYQAQYREFARAHDRAAEEMIPELRKGADPTAQRNLQQASQDLLREAGFSDEEMANAWHHGGMFHLRDARAQRILADAARWRLAQSRMKEATRRPVPPVQRPGVILGPSDSDGELSAISARLSRSGSIKDAVELRKAMLAQRNRS
jgi:hypothetical protein